MSKRTHSFQMDTISSKIATVGIAILMAIYIADVVLKNTGHENVAYYFGYGIGCVIGFIEHLFA